MTRFVTGPDVALHLAAERAVPSPEHQLVAPALLRSQVLTLLYEAVARGELSRKDASARLDHLRGLRMRLLGDRVLQANAWRIAEELGWADTYTAEYIAVTQLQADAFVTLDAALAEAVAGVVRVARVDELF
ncbi:type II toxin-antitoxin system VapC family toxin [Leifsonia sp. YIM 134122]|uniref:Type II toxin-antitoxin system VapC family toxin n=1 Tax=Leifsonia stereocauli TaxID=3134136 RepID=A0ABU9VZV8_9MICO